MGNTYYRNKDFVEYLQAINAVERWGEEVRTRYDMPFSEEQKAYLRTSLLALLEYADDLSPDVPSYIQRQYNAVST